MLIVCVHPHCAGIHVATSRHVMDRVHVEKTFKTHYRAGTIELTWIVVSLSLMVGDAYFCSP